MKTHDDNKIERLLRSAARTGSEPPAELPFGFETRVVALWRAGWTKPNGISTLIRRVALVASAVIVVVGVAGFWEMNQSSDTDDSFTNEFAIADNAIQSEFVK